jgi:SAM-dependent methyltransferase
MSRTRLDQVDLRAAWEDNAARFIQWVRTPDHDSYWRFHRDAFLDLLPAPDQRTLDLACGEGRLSRDLKALGHHMVGVDASSTMLDAARTADPGIAICRADAAALPLADGTFDLVVAFMSLHDIDDFEAAIQHAGRVLVPGGRLCLAIVHPINTAGMFEGEEGDSPFVIRGSYLDRSFHRDDLSRDGLEVTFVSAHRPLQSYGDALASAGFVIERLVELPAPDHSFTHERGRRWQRLPLFLHLQAVKL